jgi:hypothetical protein
MAGELEMAEAVHVAELRKQVKKLFLFLVGQTVRL